MRDRIALVTGMGAISPLGRGVAALWEGLVAGRQALGPITAFDASAFRNMLAGEVKGYPAAAGGENAPDGPPLTRAARMLRDACAEAIESAGPGLDRSRTALVTGTNFGGMSAAETALLNRGARRMYSLARYAFGDAAVAVAGEFGLGGPRVNLSLSCASGTACLGAGLELIRTGKADAALCAGYDELSLFCFAGLSALRAMTPETIRPFDRRRKGTVFSEGAGAILIESEASAKRRGAAAHARLLGWSANNDAFHMTAPEKEGRGISALMRAALADAGLSPDAVDHINAHATGTPYNDSIETGAILSVFGERGRKIPVAANKSAMGHTMGAAGSLECIAAIMSLREGLIPPTVGLEEVDEACRLDHVTGTARRARIAFVMKTSYGIGGTNACVIFGRA
ncbi:MAG: beta-ketoacyl-[acyl-carrier-protein] synthase family protein [Planctomycetota bacterium]|nr:beta-ketoacyl-[acyl-carrier-protein] synthase family protein [Planctomycetota bacterium]